MNDLLKRLAQLPPEKRKLVMKKLEEQGLLTRQASQRTIPVLSRQEHSSFPASFSQMRFWLMIQLAGGQFSPLMDVGLRFVGRLDRDALVRTQNEILRRHEALRVYFQIDGIEPQMILTQVDQVPMRVEDLSALDPDQREGRSHAIYAEEMAASIDFTRAPLIKTVLVKLEENHFLFYLIVSHLVSDGWSIGVLSREFISIYAAFAQGKTSPLPELPVQYLDYTHWQRNFLKGEELKKHADFWRGKLQGAAPLNLPSDKPLDPSRPFSGGNLRIHISKNRSDRYLQLVKQEDGSLYMFVLTAMNLLFQRYSGQNEISIGSLIAGRSHDEVQDLVGLFINTLVMRTSLEGVDSFREAFRKTRETTLEVYAHQEMPYEKIMETLQLRPEMNRPVLFRVMLVVQNMPLNKVALPGLEVSNCLEQDEMDFSNADITVILGESENGLSGFFQYNTNIFFPETAELIRSQLEKLMDAGANAPEAPLNQLILDGPADDQMLKAFNQTGTFSDPGCGVAELFSRQVENHPDRIALSTGDRQLTYGQLFQQACQTAAWLRGLGLKPGALVAVALERSPEAISALLGILMAGAAYLPLDPETPVERMVWILNDSGAPFLITTSELAGQLPAHSATLLLLDGAAGAAIKQQPSDPVLIKVSGEYPAYVIYTSGSTGTPKGVVIPQKALISYALAAVSHFGLVPQDRVLQFASLSFDTAAEEIWPALLSGASLALRNDEMLQTMDHFLKVCEQLGVTVLDLPTAFWHALVDQSEELSLPGCLRTVILGGERATPERLAIWNHWAPDSVKLFNTYGPTETTIVSTLCVLDPNWSVSEVAPIGRPVAHATNYVMDRELRPVGRGIPGELCVGGANLADGYFGRPGLTAERFVPDAAGPAGSRLYKTGDLVRFLADGPESTVLQFITRIDFQVKIRGYRVELGEIESALRAHEALREVLVTTYQGASGIDDRLAAWLVGERVPESELRDFLRKRLPPYMIPSAFVFLDEIPMTPSGKPDRKALPDPEPHSGSGDEEFVAPETEVEVIIAEIWQKVLGVARISIFDNFFDLGGNSLLTTLVLHHIRKELDVALSLQEFFEDPTIGNLAIRVEEILLAELEDEEEA